MTEKTRAWFDAITWVLIYSGLLVAVAGLAISEEQLVFGWSLGVVGGLATAGGVIMVYIRSRMKNLG